MGAQFDHLKPSHQEFVENAPMFFVATAAEGRVNLSPKGLDSLRILSPNKLVRYNFTGSGNETASHILQNSRMTLLFVSFEAQPLNIRIFGEARIALGEERDEFIKLFDAAPATRQVFVMDFDLVTTSCGFSAPIMEVQTSRAEDTLLPHFARMTVDEIRAYQLRKNTKNLDGQATDITAGSFVSTTKTS